MITERQILLVGECLIWTLQQGLAGKWDDELEEAWVIVYTVLSDAMIKNQEAVGVS